MPSIELVTHCYSSDEVPIYHRLLQLQLSSLCHVLGVDFRVSVCFTSDDRRTTDVLRWFVSNSKLDLNLIDLDKTHLFRRAIGRNLAAKATYADAVWFTDCDYLFTGTALSSASIRCRETDSNLVYPKSVLTHTTHAVGDAVLESMQGTSISILNPIDHPGFSPRKQTKAIGGIQIVKGSYARQFGYLDKSHWVKPVDANKGFRSCTCDKAFRRQCDTSERVDIVGVFRARHSKCGRDKGRVNHAKTS